MPGVSKGLAQMKELLGGTKQGPLRRRLRVLKHHTRPHLKFLRVRPASPKHVLGLGKKLTRHTIQTGIEQGDFAGSSKGDVQRLRENLLAVCELGHL